MLTDETIDTFLFYDWGPGTSVQTFLERLNIPSDKSKEVYHCLCKTKLFEDGMVSYGDDYLMLSKFGRSVKNEGGWIAFKKKEKLREEKERLEISQL